MKYNKQAKKITTTYIKGNVHAKQLYEKVGFVQLDEVDEDGIQEVNMEYIII